tara:strand:- start:552 stop:938 length:387 start_codon:yes stop_codon:yes gene_type:complete
MTDHLLTDSITVQGQNYALVSIVSNSTNQKHEQCGMKIRGVFNTRGEAEEHVNRIRTEDKTFDVYLVDMYKWLLIPPDNSKIDDQTHIDEKLNNIIITHKEEQFKAKELYELRKDDLKNGKVDPIDDV